MKAALRYCTRCVMPDTKPDLHFDARGVCSACRSFEEREEVDWDVEDNQAGYYSWLKSFDQMVKELVEDGYMLEEGDPPRLVPTETEEHSEYSFLTYPKAKPE